MKRRVLAIAALAALAVGVTVTLIEGRPRHLPGVALGSPVLLHAERALTLFAVTVAMLSIGVRAARGRLPIELSTSGLRYEAEAADRAAAAVAELQEQYDDLLAVVDELADRLDAAQRRPTCEERDGHPADSRNTSPRLRPRAHQGPAGTQRASPR